MDNCRASQRPRTGEKMRFLSDWFFLLLGILVVNLGLTLVNWYSLGQIVERMDLYNAYIEQTLQDKQTEMVP